MTGMKRIFSIMAALMMGCTIWAQDVFTVVFATSDDGFVNVRSLPSNKGRVLTKLWMFNHGLGNGVLLGQKGNWSKVSVGKVTGWAYSKYVGTQTWYKGDGSPRLVATRENTPIYGENYKDGGEPLPLFATVKKGTILGDTFTEDGKYYMLTTAHDNLYIRKSDAKVVR